MKATPLARQPGWTSILLLSLAFCGAGRAQLPAAQAPAQVQSAGGLDWSKADAADADRLYAQIWVNSSPEYRAICRQTFNAALFQIRRIAEQAPRVEGVPVGARGKPLAVVADLDETILDNSGFQTEMILADRQFSSQAWERWVQRGDGVGLVPGAGRFLQEVQRLGVTMIYLSNRSAASGQATVATLKELGVDVSGLEDASTRRLLLKTDSSDKEARRLAAAEAYDVVAFLGDNLGDFPEILGSDNDRRRRGVETYSDLLGTRWFVLPNPAYGDWTKEFRELGPREFLRRSHEARRESHR